MYLLGYDLGSSSVKASILDAASGKCIASTFFPKEEMPIIAVQKDWAEQNPEVWWTNLKKATADLFNQSKIERGAVKAIGISYQMHGLVLVDKDHQVLRPSIIWCDSRATQIGDEAFQNLGEKRCLESLLNSPGNFTASKLRWVKENEPETFNKIYKILLPGDYIAMKLTGEINTTISGLSEGIFWNFKERKRADFLLEYYEIPESFIPKIVPTFSEQGVLHKQAADELGLAQNTPVAYRAGDQPNNAFSLNVLAPGEVAATAGTSGVIYSVCDKINYDPLSRVNSFAHVNHGRDTRLGILLCINGCGILNSWLRKLTASTSYEEMNQAAEKINVGSEGLTVLPFGNGAERILQNKNIGASLSGINYNIHSSEHLFRAGQEGVAFAMFYGMEIMKEMGLKMSVIRAAQANLFLSPIFRETLSSLSGAEIQLYNTDGSIGAARGAGLGIGVYKNTKQAFEQLKIVARITPDQLDKRAVKIAYEQWKEELENHIK